MAESTTDSDSPKTKTPDPLRAVHSEGFPELLRELGISLLVTTYKAGFRAEKSGKRGRCKAGFSDLCTTDGMKDPAPSEPRFHP